MNEMFEGRIEFLHSGGEQKVRLSQWKRTMKDFVENTMEYLGEYHQRSNSESGFSADKKMLEWNIAQKRSDRIDNALCCTGVWHNLFNMGRPQQ